MEETLKSIENLLRQYGHVYQANLAEAVSMRWLQAPEAAAALLNTNEWWSDKDAIAAVDLAIEGGFSAQARSDGQRLRRALVQIYEQMQNYGQINPEAEIVVSQFNKWLNSHI